MRSIFAGVKDSFKEASDNFSGLFSSQNKSVKDNDSEEGKHVDDVDIEY